MYLNLLLTTLLESNRILPIDKEAFMHLYVSYIYSTGLHMIELQSMEEWLAGVEMIFSNIHFTNPDFEQNRPRFQIIYSASMDPGLSRMLGFDS